MKKLFWTFLLVFFIVPLSSAKALQVNPNKIEISGNPGETLEGNLTLTNNQEAVRNYVTSFQNFKPKGNSGIPEFVGNDYGLATWIRVPEEAVTLPGEETVLPFLITIPDNAIPGGYFAAIFFENNPNETEFTEEKVGVLVFLTVNGDIKKESGLSFFSTQNNKTIVSGNPFIFEYTIFNNGGDRVVPQGSITVENMFKKRIMELDVNPKNGNVFPMSTRNFEVVGTNMNNEKENFFRTASKQWQHFYIGIYTAKIEIRLFSENDPLQNRKYTFVVIPWQLLLIVSTLGFLLYALVKNFLTRYNKILLEKQS